MTPYRRAGWWGRGLLLPPGFRFRSGPQGCAKKVEKKNTFKHDVGVSENIWLLGGLEPRNFNELYDFPIILGIVIPTDELIFFRGVGIPPTRWTCMSHIPQVMACTMLFIRKYQKNVIKSLDFGGVPLDLGIPTGDSFVAVIVLWNVQLVYLTTVTGP